MQRIIRSLLFVSFILATLPELASVSMALAQTPGTSFSQPKYEVKLSYDVKVAMRDGVKLSTDIYRPKAPGKYGVVVIRTPYDNNSESNVRSAMYFAKRGFAVVVQGCRGREDSEGEWIPFVHEDEDGYDTIEWAAEQPWSNSKVGTYGGSYVGQTPVVSG
jgi:predicted acyl esterase